MSAHDIIEATLPEGSKRSRPPPELERSLAATKEPPKITVEEEETEEIHTSKRLKSQPNGHADKTAADVEMQAPQISAKDKKEKLPPIKVPPMPAPSSQPSNSTKSLFGPKSSMPKEPSKLRFSVQPEPGSTPPSPVPEPKAEIDEAPKPILSGFTFNLAPAPAAPAPIAEKKETVPPTNLSPAFTPQANPAPLSTAPPKSAKDVVKSHSVSSLPTFTFTFPVPSTSGESRARDKAKTMSKTSLPTFDLTKSVVPPPSSTGSFNWGAAGVKPPAAPTCGEWTCDVCMLKNPASATTKCTICDAPKPDSAPPKPVVSFDWAAAGMKPVNGPSEGEWTCSTCSLRNPVTATEKCTICDTLKPGAVTETPKPAPFFNWAAAGMKPAPGPANGEWVCNVCLLKNPATATSKCGICDAPKPGASVASTPKMNGFDWAAVGMKAPIPASAGEWNCGLCGLKNPANATAKCNICDAPRS
ncbi:E3 SUMO-protein ligase RanBP2 [Leucoagaricus sp. SymC.cos]|nr:E3 SUMO-protein ligase RanBP2 [Leucoagaricus sp. SymC.cos]